MLNPIEPRPPRDAYYPYEEAIGMIGIKKSTAYARMAKGKLLFKPDDSGHRYIVGYEVNCYWRRAMNLRIIPYGQYEPK